jgi:hypothetical protein
MDIILIYLQQDTGRTFFLTTRTQVSTNSSRMHIAYCGNFLNLKWLFALQNQRSADSCSSWDDAGRKWQRIHHCRSRRPSVFRQYSALFGVKFAAHLDAQLPSILRQWCKMLFSVASKGAPDNLYHTSSGSLSRRPCERWDKRQVHTICCCIIHKAPGILSCATICPLLAHGHLPSLHQVRSSCDIAPPSGIVPKFSVLITPKGRGAHTAGKAFLYIFRSISNHVVMTDRERISLIK